MELLSSVAQMFVANFGWFIGLYIGFGLLSRHVPQAHPDQPLWRKDSWTDVLYWFVMPPFYMLCRLGIVAIAIALIFQEDYAGARKAILEGFGPLGQLPLWLQMLGILLIGDLAQYWAHRWMHNHNGGWRYHSIHHCPEEIDWMTATRFHPVNYMLFMGCNTILPLLLGFSPIAFALLAPFNAVFSPFVHANLPWTLGPLRYVIASPVFHRWHHTTVSEGGNKNFAPTFPFIDLIFGTFYMPEGRLPEKYGIEDGNVPTTFHGQLLHPYKKPKA